MKKRLAGLLAILLLAGCGVQDPGEQAEPTAQAADQEPVHTIELYDPQSAAEAATGGAVRAYPLGDGEYVGLAGDGQRLLVISGTGDLTLLQGEGGQIVATGTGLGNALRMDGDTVTYYDPEPRELVVLDGTLRELQRILMPQDMLGEPVVLPQTGEVFYCIGTEIRAMSLNTGISRLVRSHSCADQQLVGSFFDGTVLGCRITGEDGTQRIGYLDAQTGRMIHEDTSLGMLYTYGENYFALRTEGTTRQALFGAADGETMCLNVEADNLLPALELGGAVRYQQTDGQLRLWFYDFATGRCPAMVTIPDAQIPAAVRGSDGCLWLLCGQVLYRWDVSHGNSLTDDATVYTGNLYTADSPDTEGLAQCAEQADTLSRQYGITLSIWQDVHTGSYAVETEYQTSAIRRALEAMEPLLAALPQGFLETSGNIRVNLVRSVEGGQQPVVYRQGGAVEMLLPCENAGSHFLWALGMAVDTRVLGNSRDYDFWDDLNPDGFSYTYSAEPHPEAEAYLQGENRAFVDGASMTYPNEDRARIFAAAMDPENAELFSAPILQEKLTLLCQAIREAYGLDDSPEAFPWEQHLQTPLAKTE